MFAEGAGHVGQEGAGDLLLEGVDEEDEEDPAVLLAWGL